MNYLVVEDSRIDQRLIETALREIAPHVDVRFAGDAYEARRQIVEDCPRLILLDLELPLLRGERFLQHLMASLPLPVVVVTRTVGPNDEMIQRLRFDGALDVILKPKSIAEHREFTERLSQSLCELGFSETCRPRKTHPINDYAQHSRESAQRRSGDTPVSLVAIGASTGGPLAIEQVLARFNESSPPVIVAQHISEHFVNSLVSRLDNLLYPRVVLAGDGMSLQPGSIYVVPPRARVTVESGFRVRVRPCAEKQVYSPCINTLFSSIAELNDPNVVAMVLTGMGDDGVGGLKRIREAGALTIAQAQEGCAVFGMPRCAHERDAASMVLSPDQISEILEKIMGGKLAMNKLGLRSDKQSASSTRALDSTTSQ